MAELARPERRALRARVGLPAPPPRSRDAVVTLPARGPGRSGRGAETRTDRRGEPSGPGAEPVVLSLATLRRFLECPLQAWAGAVLGLRQEDDDDLVAQRDEPFERGPLSSAIALREVFLAHLAAGGDPAALERAYRERAAIDEQCGQAPTGPFARADERRAGQILRAWWDALVRASGGGSPPPALPVGFGWTSEGERTGLLAPSIDLEVDVEVEGADGALPVMLVGRTEPLAGPRLGSLLMVASEDPSPRYRVRGAIDRAALAAGGLLPLDGRHAMTILSGAGRAHSFRFAPMTAGEGRAYLVALVQELLARAHDYLLPCEAVLVRSRRNGGGVREAIRDLVASGRFFSSRGGPLRIGPHFLPPDEAEAMIARRFGPWFDRMEEIRE
jgi:exodeoxyribonuclease V gamma subunit